MKQDIAFFISRRIVLGTKGQYAPLIAKIALATVVMGVAVLVIASNIYLGFQQEIVHKLFCFAPHIEVTKFDVRHTFEEVPLNKQQAPRPGLQFPTLERVEFFIQKAGLLKSHSEMAGVVARGIDTTFGIEFFRGFIRQGRMLPLDTASRWIVIGERLARQLRVSVDSPLIMYFVNHSVKSASLPRPRKLTVSGIYRTGLEELDANIILVHIDLLRQLNKWSPDEVGGYGLYLKDFKNLNSSFNSINDELPPDVYSERINERYPQFFEWFLIIGRNVQVIMAIIIFITSFNIAASMLILIIEKTNLIGTLKALGASFGFIRRLFVYIGLRICLQGLLIGNLLALVICWAQSQFKILKLNSEMYYMDFVPIAYDWWALVLHNLLVILVIVVSLAIPTLVISRISPIQAIKFQ